MNGHLGDRLIDYALGLLAPHEQAGAEAHLRECHSCRAELAQHQAIRNKLAEIVPARLSDVPPGIRTGWPQVAARVPRLRAVRASAPQKHSLPGFIGAGLAMTAAALLFVVITTEALLGLSRPPLTATAYSATQSITPISTVTYTPERPAQVATPVVLLYTPPVQAPRPAITTARP